MGMHANQSVGTPFGATYTANAHSAPATPALRFAATPPGELPAADRVTLSTNPATTHPADAHKAPAKPPRGLLLSGLAVGGAALATIAYILIPGLL